jgi:hypothetical protein
VKVLGVSVPILTSDIDAAIARYEALTGEVVTERFELPNGDVDGGPMGGNRFSRLRRMIARFGLSAAHVLLGLLLSDERRATR